MARVSALIPVTLLQAENEPNMGRRFVYFGLANLHLNSSKSRRPFLSNPISTTSAVLFLHERRFEWCSYGPVNTTHLSLSLSILTTRSRRMDGTAIPMFRKTAGPSSSKVQDFTERSADCSLMMGDF